MSKHDVIIIGAGIAGMTAAFQLKQQGFDVLVLEEQQEPGGNIKTLRENGVRMEIGPHSFMGSSEFTWKLVDNLKIHDAVEPASSSSKNRYIFRHNRLKPLPMSAFSFIKTSLLSPGAKFRLMLEPVIPNGAKEDESAWEFFCRRFGKEAATYIMTPFVSGVYAGDVKMLGARAAFTKFWQFEKDTGSMIRGAFKYMKRKRKRLQSEGIPIRRGLYSFSTGLGTVTEKLAKELNSHIEKGVSVRNIGANENDSVVRFKIESTNKSWETSAVILATPPPQAGGILNQLFPDLVPLFNKIPMSPVILVHWRVRDDENNYPDGFGFLMPRLYNLRVLGTLFPAKLFKNRIEKGWQLFSTYYGGMTDAGAMKLDDNQITDLLLREHQFIFNRELKDAEVIKILRYPAAIPQLLPDHPERVQQIQSTLSQKKPGIFLAGNYLTGVGIEHAVESGFKASTACSGFLAERVNRSSNPN